MRGTARLALGVLTAVMVGGAALPTEAGFIFDRGTRRKMVRTFRPIKKIKKIKGIKKGFTGSNSRPSRRRTTRRTYRRSRVIRRRR